MSWAENAIRGLSVARDVANGLFASKAIDTGTYASLNEALGAAEASVAVVTAASTSGKIHLGELTGDVVADRALLEAKGVAEAIEDAHDMDQVWALLGKLAEVGLRTFL